MLTGLSIRDIVLVEALDLAFGPGLTVLTGETGAGKSIILDALGLATGAFVLGRDMRTSAIPSSEGSALIAASVTGLGTGPTALRSTQTHGLPSSAVGSG